MSVEDVLSKYFTPNGNVDPGSDRKGGAAMMRELNKKEDNWLFQGDHYGYPSEYIYYHSNYPNYKPDWYK
jgi:hypothetical protein